MQRLLELLPGPLLKLGLGFLARYCTHQETISGTREQVNLPFDQDWNDLGGGGGALFESDSTKHRWAKMRLLFKLTHGQLVKSSLGPWPDIAFTWRH